MDNGNSFEIPLSSPPPGGYRQASAERPSIIEQLRAEARGVPYRPAARKKQEPQPPDPHVIHSLFTVETGSRWMDLGEREPAAKMLFGEFWHQGELSIMFADTNVGKSVLAVQIANNIARAKQTGPFTCEAKPERVLYVDFELTTIQFYQRYSHPKGDHEFPTNFYRAQFNPANGIPDYFKSYDDFLIAGLQQKIMLVKATVLIIDNISCLRGGTESAAVALRLMSNLKGLKNDHKLSILVLAHTPKRRNPARPICAEDLHGSKLLINFADSAFAIGKSTIDNGLCYIKQIKQRNTQQLYGEDNVTLCRITKTPLARNKPGKFLHFEFEGYDAERPHIQIAGRHGYNRAEINYDELAAQIATLTAGGFNQQQIASALYMSVGTVNKLLHQHNSRQNNSTITAPPPKSPQNLRHGDLRSGMRAERRVPRRKPCYGNEIITNEDEISSSPVVRTPPVAPANIPPVRVEIIPPQLRHRIGVPLHGATACTPENNETAMDAFANGPP